MDEKELRAFVENIVKTVIAEKNDAPCIADDKKPCALVIGNKEKVPQCLSAGVTLCSLSEYENASSILRYKKIIICELTLLQLSDISLGRPGDKASCAVLNALLNGIETVLLEERLPYKKYKGNCNAKLYAVLENTVKTLQNFGVKLYNSGQLNQQAKTNNRPLEKTENKIIPGDKSAERLITEERAKALAQSGEKEIHLAAKSIITPSAEDIFRLTHIKVFKDL